MRRITGGKEGTSYRRIFVFCWKRKRLWERHGGHGIGSLDSGGLAMGDSAPAKRKVHPEANSPVRIWSVKRFEACTVEGIETGLHLGTRIWFLRGKRRERNGDVEQERMLWPSTHWMPVRTGEFRVSCSQIPYLPSFTVFYTRN